MLFQFGKDGGSGKWKLVVILAGAALGILLLLFGSTEKTVQKPEVESVYTPAKDEMVIYQEYLEDRIKSMCQSVTGVGNATVIVTLSGGFESVYATEINGEKEEYVIIGSGSSAQALFLSRNAPDIAGIGVVCDGGNSPTVQNELIALLSSALRIPTNRIHVSKAK